MRVKMDVNRDGILYKVILPEITLEGYQSFDKYTQKHFPEKNKVILINCLFEGFQYKQIIDICNSKEVPHKVRKNRKNNFAMLMVDITQFVNDPARLCDEDGNFVSSHPGGPGTGIISIGYLEEVCEWLYYHNDLTPEEKRSRILLMEGQIRKHLNGINYIPTWSTKLNG